MLNIFHRVARRRAINCLKNFDPDKIVKFGEDKLIPAFKNAVKHSPGYRHFLKEQHVEISQVRDIESFKRLVPVIDKNIFEKYTVAELCHGGDLSCVKRLSISSGFSGVFSYGASNERELCDASFFADTLLDYFFDIEKKTLWISALGMGVKVCTGLTLLETSVRADLVIEAVKKLSTHYESIIIIGNTFFTKKIIEDGLDSGIEWKKLPVNFLIGEDLFPENYRDYLATLMGVELNQPGGMAVISTMGLCEIGLSLFQEFPHVARIRRLADKDETFRTALFGKDTKICPMLFQYHPYQTFLESIDGRLVFTPLSRRPMVPLIRYTSNDIGKLYEFNDIKKLLAGRDQDYYMPEFKLSLVSVMGRSEKRVEIGNYSVTPEMVKSGIYSDFETANATTGYFRMSKKNNSLLIEIQLREKREPTDELNRRFTQAIAKYVESGFEALLYSYRNFPYGMGLIYENKFKYI